MLVFCCAPYTRRPPVGSGLSVMTFNIRYGTADDGENRWERRRDILLGLLNDRDSDIIGLQEALHFQLEEIVTALPHYAWTGAGRDDGHEAGEYAAILYRKDRFRMENGGTFWFSDTPDVPGSRHWGNTVTRICTWAEFTDIAAGDRLFVYNVHLDHESQASREKSVRMLIDSLRNRASTATAIVTGDFNAGESNPAIRTLVELPGVQGDARYIDTFRLLHPTARNVGTYHAFKGHGDGDKIDYIFVSPGVGVRSAEILRDYVNGRYPSDHFPVVANLGLH